jgi:hypothetical protein
LVTPVGRYYEDRWYHSRVAASATEKKLVIKHESLGGMMLLIDVGEQMVLEK